MNKTHASTTRDRGYDAPASLPEHDHLNRWPFAQEIYRIAITGPKTWSVRVGVYGEWGTGKTSVLEFVETMARADGHVALRFNPWEFSDSSALWNAFVISLDAELSKYSASWKQYNPRRLKKTASRATKVINPLRQGVGMITQDPLVTLPLLGVDLLKKFFEYNRSDLQDLLKHAEEMRILILIDDLDRTSATVVPEILYALKEVMDIPGLAFICAFDPAVVGQVLKERHPGFGDGLKFLEKIIDYPRWLPVPPADGLLNLALADAKEYCDYVPESALREAIPLLPTNPRAVRQFIRMLTLMRPQVDRHYPRELRWPVILAANVLKVRFPHLAHPLLNDAGFWRSSQVNRLLSSQKERQLDESISGHVKRVIADQDATVNSEGIRKIEIAVKSLCSHISIFSGLDSTGLAYQMNVAEAPHAVTWKEFDSLLSKWREKEVAENADSWITEHATCIRRPYADVYRECFDAALQEYKASLTRAQSVMVETAQPAELRKAESLFSLLECLTSQLGRVEKPDRFLDEGRFESLLKQFAAFAGKAPTAVDQVLRDRESALLVALASKWGPALGPLIKVLQPFQRSYLREIDNQAGVALYKQICAQVLPEFAGQVLDRFHEEDFAKQALANQPECYGAINIILNVNGPLWKDNRDQALKFFRDESQNFTVRENIFELLHWFTLILRERTRFENLPIVEELLRDQEIVRVWWETLISSPLGRRPVLWLEDLPTQLRTLGTTVDLPNWWGQMLAGRGSPFEGDSPVEEPG